MKVLSNSQFKSLPAEVQAQITDLLDQEQETNSRLKKEVEKVENKRVRFRIDTNFLSGLSPETSNSGGRLEFFFWEKTQGEQWGNNTGMEISLHIGTKYIYLKYYRSGTEGPDGPESIQAISSATAMQIIRFVNLINEADKKEDPDVHILSRDLKSKIANVLDIQHEFHTY